MNGDKTSRGQKGMFFVLMKRFRKIETNTDWNESRTKLAREWPQGALFLFAIRDKIQKEMSALRSKSTAGYLQSSSLYRPFSFNYVQSAYFFPRNVIKHHFCFLVFTDCIYFFGVERLVLRESDCAIMMFRAVNDLYLSIYTNPLLNEELMTHFWIILFFFYAFIFNNVLDRFHSALTLILFVRGIFADRAEYFTFLLGKFRIECASLQTSYGIWQVLHGFLYWHFKM